MSFCAETLKRLLDEQRTVVRVVIAKTQGSSPREAGASLWVHAGGEEGTIGGGALEYTAIQQARRLLSCGGKNIVRQHFALGPDLGQCCGGMVSVLYERFEAESAPQLVGSTYFARSLHTGEQFEDRELLRGCVLPMLSEEMFVEEILAPKRCVWLYGAGHVGRAVVHHLAPQSGVEIFWWDAKQSRFPEGLPENVRCLPTELPTEVLKFAPNQAEHLVMTYSHAQDLTICHAVLSRGFRSLGLMGSQTKAARFRSRLRGLGLSSASISRLQCPIGDPSLGKTPHAIALGICHTLFASAEHDAPYHERQRSAAS